mmetsp:Transcript_19415/g.31823  ORF Transcript_19415/g.31823 Transcript_19415/m.31823 type:complete len:420 (-) Transcript_19415:1367-2626(-)
MWFVSSVLTRRAGRSLIPHLTSAFKLTEAAVNSKLVRMATSGTSTMEIDSYAKYSRNQYDAHRLTRGMLGDSMGRLAVRCKLEDDYSEPKQKQRRLIADLGSADGSSSLATLDFAVRSLQRNYNPDDPLLLNVTFEEHPKSDEKKLRSTLESNKKWFERNDITWNVLMKSFYEPLFDRDSVDFLMSYICLHWLDTTDLPEGEHISYWKSLGDENRVMACDWVQINEASAPLRVQEEWRSKLAVNHLAKFLALRAREIKPGAEMLLVMVGQPHEFITLTDKEKTGPLTRALKRCVAKGKLRRDVIDKTVVPYYIRTVDDVRAAVQGAESIEIDNETPGAKLEIIDCRSIAAVTKDDNNGMDGIFDLFWSIHMHCIQAANPSEEEFVSIKEEARKLFDEIYDANEGVPSTFVACTLRRRQE